MCFVLNTFYFVFVVLCFYQILLKLLNCLEIEQKKMWLSFDYYVLMLELLFLRSLDFYFFGYML